MGELHSSSSARSGNLPNSAVTKGIHADNGAFPAAKEVWCQQCGFPCNLVRDAKNIDEFSGQTIVDGNELTNGSFENWTASNPDNWIVSGAVTQETTSGFFDWRDGGVSSVKIQRSGSDVSLSQAMTTPSDFNSNKISFGVRVKSSTNGVVRLRVDANGISYYSPYNIAQQRFQDISLLVELSTSVSSLTVYIMADNQAGTAYVDAGTLSRNGNPSSSRVDSGCPHCGSYNYSNRPNTLTRTGKKFHGSVNK